MIASEKSKLAPRDTFLINDVVEKNNDTWAELFKLGEKITNKPQLVKVQDLILLPTGRAAKSKAKTAIKNLIPLINKVLEAVAPTYSWSYETWLQLLEEEDLEDHISDDEDTTLTTTGETTQSDSAKEGSQEENKRQTLPRKILVRNMVPPRKDSPRTPRLSLAERLDSPSITTNPQIPEQVRLDAVQDLSAVLGPTRQSGSRSEDPTLEPRPRPSYRGL